VDLAVSEGGTTTEGTIRILGLDLSADKLDLRRGEETRLQVEVRGLEGLEEPVPIEITNQSPAVVRVEGGESQGVTLRPADVRPDGTAVVERDVTGRKPGGFSISAVVPAVAQPGGLQPGGVPRPVFQDRPPGTCACASLTATDTTERALRTKIHVSPLTVQGVQGLEVRMPRTFRHELACGSGDGRCEATPAWSVQGLQARLIGARVAGQPRELSTRGANPNQTLGLGPAPAIGYVGTDVISSPCGQATTRARSASLTLKLLLPQDVKEAIARGEEVTFDGIEVQSRWSATGCTANAVAFADAEAYTRRDAKPGFTGWNRGGRGR
jgi:hypothetical protein